MKIVFFLLLLLPLLSQAQVTKYPYSSQSITLHIEQNTVKMSYMDIQPDRPNGESVLLLHGKNFNGYYWKDVIAFLKDAGFRVIVPDQVGWGYSDKPNIHYSFNLLATNTKLLLDSVRVGKAIVIAHSMGGMLATRFATLFPARVSKLIYENPIGLEDYQTFVPYRFVDDEYASELTADFNSLKKYQQGYYPEWRPEYDQYVQAQLDALQKPNFKQATWASALTYQMIYEQPVVPYFKQIRVPCLIIIGQEDRTIVGKNLLDKTTVSQHGNYPQLGKWLRDEVKGSKLVELAGVGHIPHIQSLPKFKEAVLNFLQ